MHGNRDFLIGQEFSNRYNVNVVGDNVLYVDIAGRKHLLMHGDTLCTDDKKYQAERPIFRNAEWIKSFLSRPLLEREIYARSKMAESKEYHAEKAIFDVNQSAVAEVVGLYDADTLVHGHTHRPNVHGFELNSTKINRIVLGDWHNDYAYYCVLDGHKNFKLKKYT